MPCPTVVFFGDSTDLNATTYRQMSGRAGRRGFDKRGNIVFAGVARYKASALCPFILLSHPPSSFACGGCA